MIQEATAYDRLRKDEKLRMQQQERSLACCKQDATGRCGVGVVVIKYETKTDFLYSKQLPGVFQHRLRSPRTYSEGWSISRGRSDSYHLNGSGV